MTEGDASGEQVGTEEEGGGLPRWLLWVGLGVLALVLLGICGALVVTLDLLPSAQQPTPIPTPP